MKLFTISIFAAAWTLTACAESGAQYTPILDGAPTPAFQADLTECQTLARNQKQFDQETMAAATLGAGAGAVLGALDDSTDTAEGAIGGAIAGALAGGVASAVNASERREAIVTQCLRGRGHKVVG
ncbi:hypothetical protein [Tropicibacter naphthalenivorans]|uniref:Glycine zipper family protein n=1 Tax=Tropicibacter naphthalenivorans TaxID=441103 RepID=A0A0P1GKJ5_9RHOB|nr:hypothetical protein [Tropicibacter naphthalenivorans]CUH82536.1 hypothetical protein TRN7648_04078 [Tropicibacter naphthalenivorans]SMD09916.1 hypothetical protein SAMN04488093_12024 [Tropicibacter naphthalenivorans]